MMDFIDIGTPPASHVYPPWPPAFVKKVEQALAVAWDKVQIEHPGVIASADEDVITDKLLDELVDMRRHNVPKGFNASFFGMPARDAKLPNEASNSIDQMPDITVYLSAPRKGVVNDRHDALFYECKVLKDKRNLSLYRKEGIQRFVDGQYAWRMQHAGMIGYLYSPFSEAPEAALKRHFSRKSNMSTIGDLVKCTQPPLTVLTAHTSSSFDIAATIHERSSATGVSNPIELRHLWFK